MLRLVLLVAIFVRQAQGESDAEGLRFLSENGQRPEVTTRPSGLQYEILVSGPADGRSPNASSKCLCHYSGKFLSGVEFDSSYERGQPTTFSPDQVIKGWTEALQLMRPGDKWRICLPSELAYGDRGIANGKIPGKAVLIFELELIKIKDSPGGIVAVLEAIGMDSYSKIFILLPLLGYMLYSHYGKASTKAGKPLYLIEVTDPKNPRVFVDIKIGEGHVVELQRLEIELFANVCPRTAENFRALCTGEKGKGQNGKPLAFKDSKFHRVVPGSMVQGGDFVREDGTGGESIYGQQFEDEWTNGHLQHTKAGLLSMTNSGPNGNGSQFAITLTAMPQLNCKNVVFGQVTDGHEVLRAMAAVGSPSGATEVPVTIADCGELKSKKT